MERNFIPLVDCIYGHLYQLDSRNLIAGVFNGKGFVGIRDKFSSRFLDTELHWDNGAPFGTAKPIKDLGPIPEEIEVTEFLPGTYIEWNGNEDENGLIKKNGSLWRRVSRRDLREGEEPHGKRHGFVDEWYQTEERVPDDWYPGLLGNKELFDLLMGGRSENSQD